MDKGRTVVNKYAWGESMLKDGEQVSSRYIDARTKGKEKLQLEFLSFLHRKFPNDMK